MGCLDLETDSSADEDPVVVRVKAPSKPKHGSSGSRLSYASTHKALLILPAALLTVFWSISISSLWGSWLVVLPIPLKIQWGLHAQVHILPAAPCAVGMPSVYKYSATRAHDNATAASGMAGSQGGKRTVAKEGRQLCRRGKSTTVYVENILTSWSIIKLICVYICGTIIISIHVSNSSYICLSIGNTFSVSISLPICVLRRLL